MPTEPRQAADPTTGKRRWYVLTNDGRKAVWTYTAEEAEQAAERVGFKVLSVEPAPHARMPR